MIVDLIRRVKAAVPPTVNKTINKFTSFEKSFFTFRARPITIYTIPTPTFPVNIDRVDSISVFESIPPVIAMTSLPASMLKAPPKKKPHKAERSMVTTVLVSVLIKTAKQKHINRQE
jgi:hypothetical protein